MLAHRYQVWDWGNIVSKPSDASERYEVGVVTLAKRDRESPYEAFNELVAMHLGRAIGMPIPVGIILERSNSVYFASLRLGIAGDELPDADIDLTVGEQPELSCGMVVFDAWIANIDRQSRNFWYDYEDKKLFLFDHGQALLNRAGKAHLEAHADNIAITQDNHDLVGVIERLDWFGYWHDLICAVPREVIQRTVVEAASTGVDEREARECGEWLIERRRRLKHLFKRELHRFPKYTSGLIDPFRDITDDPTDYSI